MSPLPSCVSPLPGCVSLETVPVYTSYAHPPLCLHVTLLGKVQRCLLARVLPTCRGGRGGGGDGAVTPAGLRGGGNRGVRRQSRGQAPDASAGLGLRSLLFRVHVL